MEGSSSGRSCVKSQGEVIVAVELLVAVSETAYGLEMLETCYEEENNLLSSGYKRVV